MLSCKPAKASSPGEGQDEGGFPKHNHALRLGFQLIAGLREGDVKKS